MGRSWTSSHVVTRWACLSQRRVNFTSPSTKSTKALHGTPFRRTAHSTLWSTLEITLHRSGQIGQHWSWVSKTIWSNTHQCPHTEYSALLFRKALQHYTKFGKSHDLHWRNHWKLNFNIYWRIIWGTTQWRRFVFFLQLKILTIKCLSGQLKRKAPAQYEWSERLTPGQSGWLGAAAVGSTPALALSLFLQQLNTAGDPFDNKTPPNSLSMTI